MSHTIKVGDKVLASDFYGTPDVTLCVVQNIVYYNELSDSIDYYILEVIDDSSLHYKKGEIIQSSDMDVETIHSFDITTRKYQDNMARIDRQLENMLYKELFPHLNPHKDKYNRNKK